MDDKGTDVRGDVNARTTRRQLRTDRHAREREKRAANILEEEEEEEDRCLSA